VTGNNCGGHKRCEDCSASFDGKSQPKLFHFAAMQEVVHKDLPSLIALHKEPNSARKL